MLVLLIEGGGRLHATWRWLHEEVRWAHYVIVHAPIYFAAPLMIVIGALEYPRWRFILTIMLARSLRYFIEGVLAVFYGRRVLRFLRDYGLTMLGLVALLCLIGLAIYFLLKRLRTRRIVPATPAAAAPE